MSSLPLHPALVHLPLGLAFVLPLLVPALAWAVSAGRLPRRAWLIVVLLQAALLGGGLLARWAGEQDEERVEAVVGEAPLARHEAAANLFLVSSGGVLVLALAAGLGEGRAAKLARLATAAGALAVAGLAAQAGHAGGELVYRHGAAAAHAPAGSDTRRAAEPVRHDEDDEPRTGRSRETR